MIEIIFSLLGRNLSSGLANWKHYFISNFPSGPSGPSVRVLILKVWGWSPQNKARGLEGVRCCTSAGGLPGGLWSPRNPGRVDLWTLVAQTWPGAVTNGLCEVCPSISLACPLVGATVIGTNPEPRLNQKHVLIPACSDLAPVTARGTPWKD